MPYKDPVARREYARQWVAQRRAEWFEGKSCVLCGSTDDLQLDHVDANTKVSHKIWSWSRERREAELAKCRVLCRPCHDVKSAGERAVGEAHGSVKLTEEQVLAIRSSALSCRKLSVIYGIHFANISKIKRGVLWAYLDRAPVG